MARMEKKIKYDQKLCSFMDKYSKAFVVHADNVGSNQMMLIRKGLRPNSEVLMGKNTMMKRSIREYVARTGATEWNELADLLVGNVGVIFTQDDLSTVKDLIMTYKVPAPARMGAIAPCDVIVPAGGTGMDPSQTSFFQILNIPTKINKGTVEIVSDVFLVKKGDKVGSSEATLLAKLKINPFSYGLRIDFVYDAGSVYDPKVLDLKDEDLLAAFMGGVMNVAAVSLASGYPTLASAPHSIINGYKNVLSIAIETAYTFTLAESVKDRIANPEKYAGGGGGGGSAAPAAAAPAAAAAAKAAPAPEEEEDEEMGMSLFD
jgi:large subunit ribosomal protein LP0